MLSVRSSILITIALALVLIALGVWQETRIQSLRKEQLRLEEQLTAFPSRRPDGPKGGIRPRGDRTAEARKAISDLVQLSMNEEEFGIDWRNRADLADRVQAMNTTSLREAIAWLLDAEELDPKRRRSLLFYFLNRLAENHPADVIGQVSRLKMDLPPWLEEAHLNAVLQRTAGLWAKLDPESAWNWAQEFTEDLDKRARRSWRSVLFHGIGRKHPEVLLRLAQEEGIDGTRYLVWEGQTADEKLAAFTAVRERQPDNEEGRTAVSNALREIMLHRPFGSAVNFEASTGWIQHAGLESEDIRFITDRSSLDLSYYVDPVETGQWLDWLYDTFPEDWIRGRITGMLDDHRTGEGARAWLAEQPEERRSQYQRRNR